MNCDENIIQQPITKHIIFTIIHSSSSKKCNIVSITPNIKNKVAGNPSNVNINKPIIFSFIFIY